MTNIQACAAVCLLLVSSAVCDIDEDMRGVWTDLRGSICYQLIRDDYRDNYVEKIDMFWDFDSVTQSINDIQERYADNGNGDYYDNGHGNGYYGDYGYGNGGYGQPDCPTEPYLDTNYRYWGYNEVLCNIYDLQSISWYFKADLQSFHGLKSDNSWDSCSAFKIFISAWHLHPVFGKLNCYDQDTDFYLSYALYQYVYNVGSYWKGSEATDWLKNENPDSALTNEMKCQTVYSDTVITYLSGEVEDLCKDQQDLYLCELQEVLRIADKVDKMLEYIKSAAPVTLHYSDALFIAINAESRVMERFHPSWVQKVPDRNRSFPPTSSVLDMVKDLSIYILGNMDSFYNTDTDKGHQVHYILDLLPENYQCQSNPDFGTLCWNIGVFTEMLKTLKQNVDVKDTIKTIQVNTAVNYKEFLVHTQTERLLKLSETSQNNMITIAKELRDDIIHTVEQSAAENTNIITGTVQSGFDALSKHLQEAASFDKEIAKADIAFINGEITKYMKKQEELLEKTVGLVENILKHTFYAVAGDVAENLIKMTTELLSLYNPLKWLTGGTSVSNIMDSTADYFQAAAKFSELDTLYNAMHDLGHHSYRFGRALKYNQMFLRLVGELVESLSAEIPPWDFERSKIMFIESYNAYSPAVNVADLTELNGYWELLIDESCDLLDSTSGTVSAVQKMELGSDCFDAKGEIQKFMALNEEIFDFQFDLMDALTECVRASNSYKSANEITSGLSTVKVVVSENRNSEVLTELQMLAAYSSMMYQISVITAKENYCNVLEYREGSRPELCKVHDWNLASLLSRTPVNYHSTQDFKTVPTRPAFTGDKAFIDLKDLYAGKAVMFQIPNSDWLVERGWISSDDRHKPIYVQRFEVYLPVSSATEKQVTVKANATIGNQLRRDKDEHGTEYVINPRRSLTFTYKEGPGTCRNEKIPNPYSSDCRTMPDLCQVSTDVTETAQTSSVFPSIYAMWHLQLSGYENANLKVPVTNLDLMIGLQTATPQGSRRRRSNAGTESNHRSRRSFGAEQCCRDNMFLNETAMCEMCPSNSETKYNALLCECRPCENGGSLYQNGETCSCVCNPGFEGERCELRECKAGEEFTCNNKKCIPATKYCDKMADCDDDSDEPEGCERNSQKDCESGFCCDLTYSDNLCRLYNDTECVPNNWICDGQYDCSTKKDEANCVDGGRQPPEGSSCPDGWVYYAGTCWYAAYFNSETKTRAEAAEYCQGVGGTLAEITSETEHWFTYTLFIYTVTGKILSPGDYEYSTKNGVADANINYGVRSTNEDDFWWIEKFDDSLTRLSHDSTIKTTAKCFSINEADWKYKEQDCAAKAVGLICARSTSEHAPETKPGPSDSSANSGQLGNENIAELLKGLKDISESLNDGLEKIGEKIGEISDGFTQMQEAQLKGFEGLNEKVGEIDGGFTQIQEELKGIEGLNEKIGELDGGFTQMQEAQMKGFEGFNGTLLQLIEALKQRDDNSDQQVGAGSMDSHAETPVDGGNGPWWANEHHDWGNDNHNEADNNGFPDWGNENHNEADNNGFPDWMNNPNFPFGN